MPLTDARGVALPMALMGLALLTALMLAFVSLSVSEPVIAYNQLRATQARALADGGVQYALWALSQPGGPALASPAFVPLGPTGGFTVEARAHAAGDRQARTIVAVGWAPAPGVPGASHRQVAADAVAVPRLAAAAPCALCVQTALELAGNVTVDGGNPDPACGGDSKFGSFTSATTTVSGPVTLAGGAGGSAEQQPAAAFETVTLSPAALEALRAAALRNGSYFGPGFPAGGLVSDGSSSWSGRLVFDASRPLPGAVVFVDTIDGLDVQPGGALTTLAAVRLEAGAVASPDGIFRGWLVVNGALDIAAAPQVRGLLYAVDTVTYAAPGQGRVEGLVVAHGASGAPARLQTQGGGALTVAFDCSGANADALVAHGWAVIPGSYREERD